MVYQTLLFLVQSFLRYEFPLRKTLEVFSVSWLGLSNAVHFPVRFLRNKVSFSYHTKHANGASFILVALTHTATLSLLLRPRSSVLLVFLELNNLSLKKTQKMSLKQIDNIVLITDSNSNVSGKGF